DVHGRPVQALAVGGQQGAADLHYPAPGAGHLVAHSCSAFAKNRAIGTAPLKEAAPRLTSFPDVDDLRTVLVLFVVVEIVVVHVIYALQAGAAQGAAIVQRLQAGAGLVLDALIQLRQRLGKLRLLGDAPVALVQVAHDVLAQRLGAFAFQGGNDVHRALPVEAL